MEDHTTKSSTSLARSGSVIRKRDQYFVKQELPKQDPADVEWSGEIEFIPENWFNEWGYAVYQYWTILRKEIEAFELREAALEAAELAKATSEETIKLNASEADEKKEAEPSETDPKSLSIRIKAANLWARFRKLKILKTSSDGPNQKDGKSMIYLQSSFR